MTAQDKLLAVAQAEIGYLEKATNSQLDDKTANAGSNNWTKYARDLDKLGDVFNTPKNGYDWCAVFDVWNFVTAFGKETGMKMLNLPARSLAAGVKNLADYLKSAGRFYASGPQPGDLIFFYDPAASVWQHTGLVEKVDNGSVYTIEGNTTGASGVIPNGGGVARKSYALTYSKIAGYGRPDWALVKDDPEPKKEDDNMACYKTLNDVPGSYRPTIRKLMERGALKGYSDPDPNSLEDNIISVSEDYCRVMTTLDRLGKLD